MARYPWPANAGPYRTIDSLQHPWVDSPVIPLLDLNLRPSHSRQHNVMPTEATYPWRNTPEIIRDRSIGEFTRKRWLWRWLQTFLDLKCNRSSSYRRNSDGAYRKLQPSDWKSFAYWSRPIINDVTVDNTPQSLIPPATVDPQEVFRSLRGPRNSPHPERWVPGLQHPALPRRPSLWRSPQPNHPLPFPWECQLNPFLEHKSVGAAPLYFDLGRPTSGILFAEPETTIPLDEGDRAQPATYPFLTHMEILAVADDSSPTFPWPIMVQNPRGITCQNVFEKIYHNFQEHVMQEEYHGWSSRRQEQCSRAYYNRVRIANAWNPELSPPVNDGLRRIDYMGDRVMFRGLEPSANREASWIMFVGPA